MTLVSSPSSFNSSRTAATVTFCPNDKSRIVPPVKSMPKLNPFIRMAAIDKITAKPDAVNQIFHFEMILKPLICRTPSFRQTTTDCESRKR